MALEVGDAVPDFTLTGSIGSEDTEVSLSDSLSHLKVT